MHYVGRQIIRKKGSIQESFLTLGWSSKHTPLPHCFMKTRRIILGSDCMTLILMLSFFSECPLIALLLLSELSECSNCSPIALWTRKIKIDCQSQKWYDEKDIMDLLRKSLFSRNHIRLEDRSHQALHAKWKCTCCMNCQALVPSPVLLDPKQNPNQSKIKIQVQLGLGWHYNHIGHHPTHPTHPQLLTTKESSREKVLKGKKSHNDPPYPSRSSVGPGGQRDQEHGVVLHDQEEGYQPPKTSRTESSQVLGSQEHGVVLHDRSFIS